MKKDNMDNYIKNALIDIEKDAIKGMPDIEEQWNAFEEKINKPKRINSKKIYSRNRWI